MAEPPSSCGGRHDDPGGVRHPLPLVAGSVAGAAVLAVAEGGGRPGLAPLALAPIVAALWQQSRASARQRGEVEAGAALLGELRAALAAQVEANRRKDEFVATISHELRTPLTVLLGTAQTLEAAGERMAAADRARLLHTAVGQGQRLKVLIDDLLLVASAAHGSMSVSPTTARVADLAADLAADVPADIVGRVTVTTTATAAPPTVRTDPQRVRQVVANLVGNAAKYAADSPIEVDLAVVSGRLVVRVADHGPGIGPADRERVFDRFVQLDQSATRAQGGTGLGLYLCRQIADRLGGHLTLTETAGGGATFTLDLPAADPGATDHPGADDRHRWAASNARRRPIPVSST